jgi:hypothetical protein
MSTLPITTVVSVSVESPESGLAIPQVNNLCILSKEVPISSVPSPGYFVYQNSTDVGSDWGTMSETYNQAVAVFGQRPNILSGQGELIVYPLGSTSTLTQGIQNVEALIFAGAYVWAGYSPSKTEILAGAATAASVNKMLGIPSDDPTQLSGSGLFATLSNEGLTAPIMLLYGQVGTDVSARISMAAFMSKGMSTDFNGNSTTSTMNLKDLAGIVGDGTITPTIQSLCLNLGVNIYPNIQNIAKVLSYGGPKNFFFDTIYNLEWFANAIQVAIFNALATTNGKIPQTEQGMAVLRAAATQVCRQAVTNGFLAPGTWNGEIPFGDPATFDKNIAQNGFYVFTNPIATQFQSVRAERIAPTMQIAGKEAGAVHSANVLVFVQP